MANDDLLVSDATFIGLVADDNGNTVTAGILNDQSHEIVTQSFLMQAVPVSEYLIKTSHGLEFLATPELDRVSEFIERHVPHGSSVRLLAEADGLFPFQAEGDTPAAIFPADSAIFKVLCFLSLHGLGVQCAYYEVPERQSIVAHYVSAHPDKPSETVPNQPRFLVKGTSGAYGSLLYDVPSSPELAGVIGALIAKNHGSYYYWSSWGEPPSAADVVYYLSHGQRKMLVGSSHEQFSVQVPKIQDGLEDVIDDVALEYALAQQQWASLGENNASKAALIHVSKRFGCQIRCYSTRADAGPRDPRLVFPLPPGDDWIASKIRAIVHQPT